MHLESFSFGSYFKQLSILRIGLHSFDYFKKYPYSHSKHSKGFLNILHCLIA